MSFYNEVLTYCILNFIRASALYFNNIWKKICLNAINK